MKAIALFAALAVLLPAPALGRGLDAVTESDINLAIQNQLAASGAPSASVALVMDDKIVYLKAFGKAELDPDRPAQASMRYAIGSISKQFTAAAVLMLAEQHKLSLDEPVARWYPNVTEAGRITLRNLLTQTSGIPDFWPQDYVMAPMMKDADPDAVIAEWGSKPLSFQPGDRYEYSNTNYMIAGRIVEKVSGRSLEAFLRQRIWRPLHMDSVVDFDTGRMQSGDAKGYRRNALAPSSPALHEGSGWGVGAFQWAMTAGDLARWDICLMKRCLLSRASYEQFFKPMTLNDGKPSGYALGLTVSPGRLSYTVDGEPERIPAEVGHSGEVSGFVSDERVFYDRGAAVVVLTNTDSDSPAPALTRRLGDEIAPPQLAPDLKWRPAVLGDVGPPPAPSPQQAEAQAAAQAARESAANAPYRALDDRVGALFKDLQRGEVDRAVMTDNLSAYFTPQVVKDFADSLGPLGAPEAIRPLTAGQRGGMTFRLYRVAFAGRRAVTISVYAWPDGRLEQFLVEQA